MWTEFCILVLLGRGGGQGRVLLLSGTTINNDDGRVTHGLKMLSCVQFANLCTNNELTFNIKYVQLKPSCCYVAAAIVTQLETYIYRPTICWGLDAQARFVHYIYI